MQKYFDVIAHASVFEGIDVEQIQDMMNCLDAKMKEFSKGEYLLQAGNPVPRMGLLLSGSALIVQEDFWGNRNLLRRILPGQLFAEAFACAGDANMNVSVVADEKCSVLWLDMKRILTTCPTVCARHSRMIRNLICDLAEKNLYFNEKLTHMGQRTTREKLISYLSAQAQQQGKAEFDIPFSRQQLADYLSVERSAMSAELGKLKKEGILMYQKNHFILFEKEI